MVLDDVTVCVAGGLLSCLLDERMFLSLETAGEDTGKGVGEGWLSFTTAASSGVSSSTTSDGVPCGALSNSLKLNLSSLSMRPLTNAN